MSNQKRHSRAPKKQLTEKQILLDQRSRSIKASLLRVLSLDIAALYQINSQRQGDSLKLRELNCNVRDTSTVKPTSSSIEDKHETSHHRLPQERIEEQSPESDQQPTLNQQTDGLQEQATIMLLIFRLLAFFIGLLVHHVIQSYLSTQSVTLLGIAIAISSISVLLTVIFMPWNRKLLWNLCSLFAGLLFAVIVL
ncbi:hypothetical protein NIES2135_66390 (plasmid) [Leptolyngbya boryana NIES-2135]|jgi:hypothetical protein|uniref:Uncharacterized protein n=1 Tax=Leptolyngbya boryana NIES-2135 TaxID=1973484 RepID=A0A1Z4JSR7_LEPBY|nr:MULTISPECIES: hypothetical protein [Leptolyngbya]BAY59762.1 hypothetical protein NIES2135_66390 [Leptolyngbya boryana NIES-2135]MBD2370585.1 hypothetical protein [Leptolyngbya sp. FACHB-161]MBD2377031.1 hypothetical protein [Leptolyngbya sp. FACHB-238]MBD2401399.1 hypothetical protein [Leptolyngbya sp. FACHB-239]MBD2407950.1 hypothetical protein [Leptolyngbya sp. FACHB-402]